MPSSENPHKTSRSAQSLLDKQLPDIDPSLLSVQTVTTPKSLADPVEIKFGSIFTDHMLSIEWNADRGWKAPQIRPYQPLLLDPSASVFQYAIECYEGMKAYRDDSGGIRLFRPDRNMARFNKSAARVALPNFNPDALLSLISTFVRLEERFVPKKRGYSLYLRPTMISTNAGLGIAPPSSALLYVIATPVGPYYPTGLKAITLQATNSSVRAWPGGAGHAKIGGNYAPCIVPQAVAALSGHQQILWLFGEDGAITEVGMMNMFAAMITRDGKKELVTAPLDGTILDGVTRNSVLSLARENLVPQGWSVVERKYTMRELAEASAEGNLLEAFGTGTAATICPIRAVSWDGTIVSCGLTESAESGEIASLMKEWIESRQYGDEKHQWSYVVR